MSPSTGYAHPTSPPKFKHQQKSKSRLTDGEPKCKKKLFADELDSASPLPGQKPPAMFFPPLKPLKPLGSIDDRVAAGYHSAPVQIQPKQNAIKNFVTLDPSKGALIGEDAECFPFYLKDITCNGKPLELKPDDSFVLCEMTQTEADLLKHFPLTAFYLPASLFKGNKEDSISLKYHDYPIEFRFIWKDLGDGNQGADIALPTEVLFQKNDPELFYTVDNPQDRLYKFEADATPTHSEIHLYRMLDSHFRTLKNPEHVPVDVVTTDISGEIIFLINMPSLTLDCIDLILNDKAVVFYGYRRNEKTLASSSVDDEDDFNRHQNLEYLAAIEWPKLFPKKNLHDIKVLLKGSAFKFCDGALQMNLYQYGK